MAAKYWYVAGNGSGLWSTAANWYNGPGGTLGTTTVPTIADDVYLDAASGSGTLTIALASSFQTLDCTGFTGTLAGTANVSCNNSIVLGSSMGLTWTGTATTTGNSAFISNGKIVTFNIVVSTINGVLNFYDNFTMTSTATLTLSGGVIISNSPGIIVSVGLFVSTGAVERTIQLTEMSVTGSGTVWSVTGTNFSWLDGTFVKVTNTSASTKTITNTVTTASVSYGGTFKVSFLITGAGTGSYTANGNFYDFYCHNTGGASINFGTTTMYQNFDWGIYALPGVTPNMNWNNAASTMTFNSDYGAILFNSGMTITTSSPIVIANPTAGQPIQFSNQFNKSLTSTINISGSEFTGITVLLGNLITTGSITLTNGTIDTLSYSAGDVYCSTLSTNVANTRAIVINNLYLTGTGTLASATTVTGLTVSINNIYVTSSLSVARTLSFNTVFYPLIGVYLGGSGGSTITLAASTTGAFDVYVTNTGGASISFNSATIKSLEFSSGTNAIWSNAASQTLTIGSNLTIAASAGTPTITPTLIFNGFAVLGSGSVQAFVTLNGKSLVTGTVTINDTVTGANQLEMVFDGFSSNAAFTITSALSVTFNGPFIGTTFTSTACDASYFYSSLTLSGTMLLNNSVLGYGNTVYVTGISSIATLTHSAQGAAIFVGNANVTSSITLSNATSPSTLAYFSTLTTPTFTISNGNLESYGTLNVSGTLTLTLGNIQTIGARNYNIGIFSSSGSGVRYMSMGSGTWTLTGTVTVWNLVGTNMSLDSGTAIINITNTSASATQFTGGSLGYYTLQCNRGGATGSCIITGNNSFVNFIDLGTATHSLLFAQGNTQTIGNFVAKGTPGNIITLNSVNGVNGFNLIKSPLGVVNCDYLNIQHSIVTPSTNTWYAGPNSVNNQAISTAGSGWIFTNMPPRKLGAGGVG